MSHLIHVIHAVTASQDARHRIPLEYRDKITFFSDYDLWAYHYVHDDRVCPVCERHGDMSVIIGSKIRLLFPYLEIVDVNTIRVHEHPHCRCTLTRSEWIYLT